MTTRRAKVKDMQSAGNAIASSQEPETESQSDTCRPPVDSVGRSSESLVQTFVGSVSSERKSAERIEIGTVEVGDILEIKQGAMLGSRQAAIREQARQAAFDQTLTALTKARIEKTLAEMNELVAFNPTELLEKYGIKTSTQSLSEMNISSELAEIESIVSQFVAATMGK